MAKNSKITGLVLGSIFAGMAMTAANDAMALEVGDCKTGSEMSAALGAEGQVQIFTGYRMTAHEQKNYFTSNSNMDLGYNLEKSETVDAKICVTAKYTGIRLNADTNLIIPDWAKIAPNNSPFNQYIERQTARINARIIFAAIALTKDANGVERPTSKIVITQGDGDQYVQNQGVMAAGFANGDYSVAKGLVNISVNSNYTKLASNPSVLLASNTQPK